MSPSSSATTQESPLSAWDAVMTGDAEAVRQAWATQTPHERGQMLALACEFRQPELTLLMLDQVAQYPGDVIEGHALTAAVQKNQHAVIQRMIQVGLTKHAEAALTAALAYRDATSIALLAPVAPRLTAVARLMEDDYDDVFHLSYEEALACVDGLAAHLTRAEISHLLARYEPALLVQTQLAHTAMTRAATAAEPAVALRKARPRA